jgi:NAD(P)-dependent dehydrogenase (short-subunit alcohol dehydrogenase family)
MKSFTDKVAVITGGVNGIGLDIARQLADEKCHLVIADLDQAACDKVAEELATSGISALGQKCDVTKPDEIEALAELAWGHFGHVDLLFNNAGVGAGFSPAVKMSDADLRWVFEVNFFGNWNCCMSFARRFIAQGSEAHICNTASENALGWPTPFMAGYNATKAAVLGYSGMLRKELPTHVTLSVLCPGWTQTEIGKSGALRPAEYGGPKKPGPGFPRDGDFTPYPVETVGRHVLEQIHQGAFYIVPHYAARHLAEERHDEIIAAFEAQTEPSADWHIHDTRSFFEAAQAARQEPENGASKPASKPKE